MGKRALKSVVVIVLMLAQISMAVLPAGKVFAAADTCTWTGTTSANWSVGSNWSGCDNGGVPENGDTLVFPASASNKTTNNNLSSLQVAAITFSGSGYTIGGNAFTITSNLGITATQSATISANVTYNTGSHVNFYPASGTTLTLSGSSAFSMSSFYETNIGTSLYTGTVDFTGNITGSSASQFIVVGGAKAIVRGATNTYTATQVGAEANGVFECRSATCFGNAANTVYMGGGVVDIYNAATYTNPIITSTATADDSILRAHAGVIMSGSATINDDLSIDQQAASSLELSGTITNNSSITTQADQVGGDTRLTGQVNGTGALILANGVTYLTGNSTYTGQTTVQDQATAVVTAANALGASSTGTTVADGGALLFASGALLTVNEPISIAGSGNPASPHAITMDAGDDITLAGDITLTDDTTVANLNTGTTLYLNGAIKGTGKLTLTGVWDAFSGAYIEVAGANPNTFNGDVVVDGGTIYFDKTGAIPHNLTVDAADPSTNRAHVYFYNSSNVMNDSGIVTMGQDGTNQLTFGANNEVIGGLTGDGGILQVQDDGNRVVIKQDTNTTFGGGFYTDGQAATFEKQGTGTLNLTGNYQNLSDKINFVATAGVLAVNGTIRTTTGGNVVVNGGTLKGVGTAGAVTVNSGSLAPGNSPGTLNVTSLTMNGGTHQVEIASDSAYDKLKATGTVTLGGSLQLVPTYTPAVGTQFVIIEAGVVSGTFSGLADGATVTANGLRFRINYASNGVTLTYIGALPGIPNTGFSQTFSNDVAIINILAGIGALGVALAMLVKRSRPITK